MHISKKTLLVLKNFRDLNSNILVSPGNVIKTLTPGMNVMATAIVEEEFPAEFGIWDLGSFLGTVSLFEDPDFDFNDNHVVISSNGSKVKYYYSDPNLLTYPKKNVNMPDSVVTINLPYGTFNELKKAASVLGLNDLSFVCDGSSVSATVMDKTNATNNTYSIEIEDATFEQGTIFNFDFKIDNLRFIPGSYKMEIAEKVVSQFTNQDGLDLTYWVALEGSSSYNRVQTAAGVA